MAVRIVKHTLELIHILTDQNPVQVFVDAIINAGKFRLVEIFVISGVLSCCVLLY